MKSAKSWSVKKAKVVDRAAVSEVKDDDGKIMRLNFSSDFVENIDEEPVGAVTGEDSEASSESDQ